MALAACMLHGPQLLLLDEPTAGVDPSARRDFWDEIQALAAKGISVLVSTHYMDEAVRCHKLAYISSGTLLAQGTAQEIIDGQHLSTWAIHGDHLAELQEELRKKPSVAQTVTFGDVLHVSGTNDAQLEREIQETMGRSGQRVERIETNLEDVFIYLMSRVGTEDRRQRVSGAAAFFGSAMVGCGAEGVHSAEARPADVRDDRGHSDHADGAVRIRDQHDSAAPGYGDHQRGRQRRDARFYRVDAELVVLQNCGTAAERGSGPRRAGTGKAFVCGEYSRGIHAAGAAARTAVDFD